MAEKGDSGKNKIIILAGPTGVGKTSLSIGLAKELNGEIVSADSMQVYRHMDIGTAKITGSEMQGVPHFLIDIIEPTEEYNVTRFKEEAERVIEDIHSRNRLPIIVGGTGFYIQALLYGTDFSDKTQTGYRQELIDLAGKYGSEYLFDMLMKCDPAACEYIGRNDVFRLSRALEYHHVTGEPISLHNIRERSREAVYDHRYFVLNLPREELYERINTRVDVMIKNGLLDEVRSLKEMGCEPSMTSMKGLGYKEMLRYLDGEITFDEAVRIIKRDTRHFAKRQVTWFKREKDTIWINKDEFQYNDDRIINYMIEKMSLERGRYGKEYKRNL